jgi:hypothetical protein
MTRYLLLFLSLKLCGAAQPREIAFPTLFALCLRNIKKLPPHQFAQIQMLPPSIKESYVTKHGPLYIPTLFNVEANDQDAEQKVSIFACSSCNDMRISLDAAKTMWILKKIDNYWCAIETVDRVDMIAWCTSGTRYAYAKGNIVSLCQLDDRRLPVQGVRCGSGVLKALAFHDDYLFVKSKTNRCEQEDLFVWNFLYDRDAHCYTLWPENARFLIDGYSCRMRDEHIQDQAWLTYAFNQILFTQIIDEIKTQRELELFKQHQDKLVCDPQLFFNKLSIAEKQCKLKKRDVAI